MSKRYESGSSKQQQPTRFKGSSAAKNFIREGPVKDVVSH